MKSLKHLALFFSFFILFLLNTSITSAAFGYNNLITSGTTTSVIINSTITNSNNTNFLEGFPAAYFYPFSNPNSYINSSNNPFNQVLNTTSNVKFNNLNLTGELIVNKSVRWLESAGIQNLFYINPLDGDGFRMEYWYDFEAPNDDWLVFHKTDGNDVTPDGGIAFMMGNSTGYNKTIIKFDGYGNSNFTDQNITTTGNIQAGVYCNSTGTCKDLSAWGEIINSVLNGSGTNQTIAMWTSNNTLENSPIVREITDEDFMTFYNGTFYIDETNNVVAVNVVPGAESHSQAFQVNTFKKTGVGNLTTGAYNSSLNITLITSDTILFEDLTDASNLIIGSTHYYVWQLINETAFYISGNYTFTTTSWFYKQAPYIDINAGTNNIERGYSISTNGSWKWAWSIPINTNDSSLCFQQSDLYYQGTTDAFCIDTSSGKSLLKNNGPGAFQDSIYVGVASTYSALSNVTTKAGMFLPTKYVGVDSVAGGDSGFVFGYNNNPMWDWSTFVAESGKYLHLINYQAGHDALTIGSSGRIGVNKPSNVMNYHNGFSGTGLDDMYVGGTYTGGFNDGIEINVTSTANPNTFSYRVTVQNGATSTIGAWSAPINMDTAPITIFKGITVRWDAVTGHTLGDNWQFNAFPANPTGTFTIKPTLYNEVIYYNGSNYLDYTFPAGTSVIGSSKNNPFTIFGTTGKYVYVGRYVEFSSSQFGIAVPATGLTLKVEYWNGTAWAALTSATNYLTDGTTNLTKTGGIIWDRTTITNWATNVSVDTYNSTTGIYWIRYSSTSVGTAPTIDTITPQAIDRLAIYQSGNDINPTFSVAPNGDTVVGGTLKANGFYAELYNTSLGSQALGNNVWENISNFITGDLSGWNVSSGRILTCIQSGLYDMSYSINGAVAGNDVLNYQILVNHVLEPKGDVTYRYANGQSALVTNRFLKRFNAGDVVYLQVRDTSSARTFTYDNKNIILTRIGN
jgi:hypothetical protein